jgi:hypothetical protein
MRDPRVPEQQLDALQTLDKLTRFASEDLARGLNRRSFLRRAGGGAFGFMITLTTGKLFAPRPAAAAAPGPRPSLQPMVPACAPPGPYCNYQGQSPGLPTACHGAHCFQHLSNGQIRQCHIWYIYPAGCWTTASGNGYWTCCDCQCDGGSTCGCAQYSDGSTSPPPLPSRPIG